MINALFSEKNKFFIYGLELIIQDVINFNSNASVNFSYEINDSNISQADIIIKSFESGEQYLCQDIMLGRHQFCLVIGVFKKSVQHYKNELPKCLDGTIFIDYEIPPSEFSKILIEHLSEIVALKCNNRMPGCTGCDFKNINGRRIEISKRILNSQSQYQIAKKMGLDMKTISSHKRKIMNDFRLKNNFELHAFLKLYMKKFGS